MTTSTTPRLGRIVLYTLSEQDTREIIQNRRNAGIATARGNDPHEGDTYPALIVRDWASPDFLEKLRTGQIESRGDEFLTPEGYIQGVSVNLQVFLDGTDTYWATSRTEFNPARDGRYDPEAPEFAVSTDTSPEDAAELRAEYHAEWFRPDPRGHWTAEPVAW